jgi:bifunctional DNase/RNase
VGQVKPVDVLGVRVEMPTNQPIVLLRERNGERYLPIWIGAAEATAIAYAQQGVEPPRPLTHDLLKDIIETLGHRVTQVRIVELRDKVFYAILVIDGTTEISARPSDAIAIALRTQTEIVVAEAVLDEAGVALTPEEDDEVEKFREFLDHVSAEDFETPQADPTVDPGDEGTPHET